MDKVVATSELLDEHKSDFYQQLDRWYPARGSAASIVKRDLLSILPNDIGTAYGPHESYHRARTASSKAFEYSFGHQSEGP